MFIAFEGIDGSGKSTQARMLYERLLRDKVDVELTQEPSDSILGSKIIRSALTGKIDLSNMELAALFATDRCHHLYKKGGIIEQLNMDKTVICDRYIFSSLAYQGYGFNMLDYVEQLNDGYLLPDITFILHTPVLQAMKRVGKCKKETDTFETDLELQEKVSGAYLEIFRWSTLKNVFVVSGDKGIDKIHNSIYKIYKEVIHE